MADKIKIVALSDLHGNLPKAKEFPTCDIVCICGDIVPLDYQKDYVKSITWFVLTFNKWANSLPCEKVVFVAGNHDFFLEKISCNGVIHSKGVMKQLFPGNELQNTKLVYLVDNTVLLKIKDRSITIYGTPWIADLKNWAFYEPNEALNKSYDNIPKKVDILLTHMPSTLNDTGVVMDYAAWNAHTSYGSQYLADCILNRDIKYALCGHVHTGNHELTEVQNGCKVANVSLLDESYKVTYKPLEFEI